MPTASGPVHDVVVVGARCAGAATARLLAAGGYDVVVLDRAELPSDTLSTHGLARGGVVQLSRWGLLDRLVAGGAPPVREVLFWSRAEAIRREVRGAAGVDHLLAPRRIHLDAVLADAAVAAGATIRTRTTAIGLLRDDRGRVRGVRTRDDQGHSGEVRARYVVGADGIRSRTALWVGARTLDAFPSTATAFYTYVRGDWPAYELHIGDNAFSGVFPTHDGQACVWLIRPEALVRDVRAAGRDRPSVWRAALAVTAPDLAERVPADAVVAPVRGCVAPPNFRRSASGPGWALVGDAGYHRDPITGHGITDAFRDAELLAEALGSALADPATESGALAAYEQARDHAAYDVWRLTRELVNFPPPRRFLELQKELSAVLEREALDLASRPAPAGLSAVTAA